MVYLKAATHDIVTMVKKKRGANLAKTGLVYVNRVVPVILVEQYCSSCGCETFVHASISPCKTCKQHVDSSSVG